MYLTSTMGPGLTDFCGDLLIDSDVWVSLTQNPVRFLGPCCCLLVVLFWVSVFIQLRFFLRGDLFTGILTVNCFKSIGSIVYSFSSFSYPGSNPWLLRASIVKGISESADVESVEGDDCLWRSSLYFWKAGWVNSIGSLKSNFLVDDFSDLFSS